jgi:hypothetical protein
MSVHERPHYVIKPAELAKWLDQEPDTWWRVDGDPRLTGDVIFPSPSREFTDILRRYKNKDLFLYPVAPNLTGPQPVGQTITRQSLDGLADRDNPDKRRTFLFTWSDREEEWLLVEYPSWKLEDYER